MEESNFDTEFQKLLTFESSLKDFLTQKEDIEEKFQNFIINIQQYKIEKNSNELKKILYMIICYSNEFHRNESFFPKIEKIILYFKNQILEFFTNTEIFNVFKNNKRLLLFAIHENIVIFDNKILNIFFDENLLKQNYYLYFYPEIKSLLQNDIVFNEQIKFLNDEVDDFFQKRKIGENDDALCKIIRNDEIVSFIQFIQKEKISLQSKITKSIYETNPLLLENSPTLIEYSAFYGSINIFKYLLNNGVELTQSIWLYSIHGENYEIIKILEENEIKPLNNCIIESIKCHSFEMTQYFYENFLKNIYDVNGFQFIFNKLCLKYFNFICFDRGFVQKSIKKYFDVIEIGIQEIVNDEKTENIYLFDLLIELFTNVETLRKLNCNQKEIISNMNKKINTLQEENFYLRNQNKNLILQKANLIKKIKKANNYNKLIIGKLKKANSKINELNEQIKKLSQKSNENSEEIEYGPENLTPSLILEILKNSQINVYCRKYSKTLKDICFMLYLNSNITYKLLRKFIPLPNPDNLRKEYKTMIKNKQENLLNENQIKYLLEELRGEMLKEENEPIIATIAFDAATIDPRNQGSNGVFLYNYQPLEGDSPTKVINLLTKDNGKADDDVLLRLKDIEKAGKEVNIIFRFVASDSDSKTNILHNKFRDYIDQYEGDDFDELLEHIDKYPEMIPISDWLHLCKNLRTRFANHKIILFKGSQVIDPEIICEKLGIDRKVLTAAGRESMRDDLALKLINFGNLEKLANLEEYCCLVLLLPFVLFTDVLQSTNLTIEARKKLCFISYEIMTLLFNESKGIQTVKSKNSDKVGYLRNTMRERTQNTIIGFAYALEYYGNNLMTSRLGTHIVEFIFGHMRNGCNGYDVLDKCIFQIVKSDITKEILEKYGKDELPIAGRSHPGGACFSEKWNIDIGDDIDIGKVPNECIQLIHGNLQYKNSNIEKLITFLSENAPTKVPESGKSISCAKIQARQIHYSKKH